MTAVETPLSQLIVIEPLDDCAETGQHVTSAYCERFWLPTVGPSALCLLRHAAQHTGGGTYRVDVSDLSRSVGLGVPYKVGAPLYRTLKRLVDFRCATGGWDEGVWRIRTHLPLLTFRQVERLPRALQVAHAEIHRQWTVSQRAAV